MVRTYNSKEAKVEKEHKEEVKKSGAESHSRTEDEEMEEEEKEEEVSIPLVTHVNNFLHSFFPTLKCTSTISKFAIQMDSTLTSL